MSIPSVPAADDQRPPQLVRISRRTIALGPVIALALSIAAGFGTGDYVASTLQSQACTVEVEAAVTTPGTFRLYYNSVWSEPQDSPVLPGQWALYRFSVPGRITALRFDPPDSAEVHIRRITARNRMGDSVSLPVSALAGWLRFHVNVVSQPDAGMTHIISDRNAYLMGTVDIDLTGKTPSFLRHFRFDAPTLLGCWLGVVVVCILFCIWHRSPIAAVAVLVLISVALVIAYQVALFILTAGGQPPHVDVAVGFAAFNGAVKSADVRAVTGAILISALVTLVSAIAIRRLRPSPPEDVIHPVVSRKTALVAAFGVVLFAIASLPTTKGFFDSAFTVTHASDFDSQNVTTWEYLTSTGKLPWRDFWFPYSGMYDEMAPVVPDLTRAWSHRLIVFSVMVVCGCFLFGNATTILIICLSLFYLEWSGILWPGASWRYLPGAALVCLTAVALEARRIWLSAVVGVFGVYALAQEVSQPLYAVLPVCILAATGLLRISNRRSLLLHAGAASAVFAATAAAYLGNLGWNGQLAGWWRFITAIPTQTQYSSRPADLVTWFSVPSTISSFLVILTVLLMCGGTMYFVWRRGENVYSVLPFALGVLSLIVLQKQVVRPGVEAQIIVLPLLGLCILAGQIVQRAATTTYRLWLGFATSAVVACFTFSNASARDRAMSYVDIVTAAGADLRFALTESDNWARARTAFFRADSFSINGLHREDLMSALNALGPLASEDKIFSLTDNPYLYIMLNRPVPYYPNLYDQSPLFAQQATVAWLQQHRPRYVFWDPAATVFDDIPNEVRSPVLYNHIIANYVPATTAGKFHVLGRRRAGQAPAIAYWRDKMGSVTHLGHIPGLSAALQLARPDGSHTARYVVIRISQPRAGRTRKVLYRVLNQEHTIDFVERGGHAEYAIAADRLPFAQAATAAGHPVDAFATDADATTELRTLRFREEILY